MSRALKRQLERDLRRGILRADKIVPLPPLLDEFTIFDTPQTILERLLKGEIEAINGEPAFRDNLGNWTQICPALEGWIFTWKRISDKLLLSLDLKALEKVNNKLHVGMMLTHEEIGLALICIDDTRQAFRRSNRKEIMRLAKEAQIILFNEEKVTA